MTDLEILRNQIDQIDKELLPLFLKRMECAHKVADYKRANNMPVLDKVREKQILDHKMSLVDPELARTVRSFYSNIMKLSRLAQAKELVSDDNRTPWLDNFDKGNMKENPLVAYQGVPGANSETALIKFFGEDCKRINTTTFAQVVDAVEEVAETVETTEAEIEETTEA